MQAQKAFPDMRFFQRHVGLFKTLSGHPIKINRPGMADVWAINTQGKHFEIEFKTGSGKLSASQKKWKEFCNAWGLTFIEVNESNPLVETLSNIEALVTGG